MANATIAELRAYLDIQDTTTFTADHTTERFTLASVPFVNTLQQSPEPTEVTVSNSGGALPAGLAANTTYYVILVADQVIQLATTSALAIAGTALLITDNGTGTHTITRAEADTANLTNALNGAIRYIEQETNRVFVAAADTRYYSKAARDEEDHSILHLDDDCVTVTTLTNGDSSSTAIAAANYWLLDRNYGPPYRAIKLKSDYAWEWDQDCWVTVVGTWGWAAACPADVKSAQLHLAAFLYRQAASQVFDITAIPEQGVIQIPQGIPATVTRVIDKYRKRIL